MSKVYAAALNRDSESDHVYNILVFGVFSSRDAAVEFLKVRIKGLAIGESLIVTDFELDDPRFTSYSWETVYSRTS